MYYKSFSSLRRQVERKYGRPIPDGTWEILRPDDNPPFDDYYVEDILGGIRDYKPKEKRKKHVFRAIQKSWNKTGVPFTPAVNMRPKIRYYRKNIVGLSKPVPIKTVRKTLKDLNPVEMGKSATFLYYPKNMYSMIIDNDYSIDICEVSLIPICDDWNEKSRFVELVNNLSAMLGCPPAVAVAFILCDIVPKSRLNPVIIIDDCTTFRPEIGMFIPTAEMSVGKITKAYIHARETIIKNRRKIYGKRARPRAQTERVSSLLSFIDGNSSLSWNDLFTEWNAKRQDWFYSSVHTMQVTYYRARHRE